MENSFKEGQEVDTLFFPDDSMVEKGSHGVEKITVVMEYGQMAGVPWFAVWREGEITEKHNGALVASVRL